MKFLSSFSILCSFLFISSHFLHAKEYDYPLGKTLYTANCASCHGIDSNAHGHNLGGTPQQEMYSLLITMRQQADEGKEVAAPLQTMLNILAGLNNEDIATIASYISTLPKAQ